MLCSLFEHVKGRNLDVEGCGLNRLSIWLSLPLPSAGINQIGFLHYRLPVRIEREKRLAFACPSLRWHYPDQVQPVGGEIGHPLSLAFPSSHSEQI
jgi:hypothetical protein